MYHIADQYGSQFCIAYELAQQFKNPDLNQMLRLYSQAGIADAYFTLSIDWTNIFFLTSNSIQDTILSNFAMHPDIKLATTFYQTD